MKTKAIALISILILSIVVVDFSVSNAGTGGISEKSSTPKTGIITYQVNVHLANNVAVCGAYMVVVRNAGGGLVAPAQPYEPEKVTYYFTEKGPVSGSRVATLVRVPNYDPIACNNQLFTAPASIYGTFSVGMTYSFDLYPQLQGLPH